MRSPSRSRLMLGLLLAAMCLLAGAAPAAPRLARAAAKPSATAAAPRLTAAKTTATPEPRPAANSGVAASAHWEPCGPCDPLMSVSSVHLRPSPVARSVPMTVRINGTMQTALTSGDILVSVSYHSFKVYSQHGSLCSVTTCPLHAGPASIQAEWVLPRLAPPGPYMVQLKATTSATEATPVAAATTTAAANVAVTTAARPAGGDTTVDGSSPNEQAVLQQRKLKASTDHPHHTASKDHAHLAASGLPEEPSNDYPVFCVNVFFDLP